MPFVAGREGSITGPDFAAEVSSYRFRDSAGLPDTTVLGGSYDTHVVGIIDGEGTLEFLTQDTQTFTVANYASGVSVTLVLKSATGGFGFTGTALLRDIELTQDVRGVSRGTATFKYQNDAVYEESA